MQAERQESSFFRLYPPCYLTEVLVYYAPKPTEGQNKDKDNRKDEEMNEETIKKAVAHIVEAMEGKDGKNWDGENPMYEGICGWGGVMSPMNRAAFVCKFGTGVTMQLEDMAKKVLEERADFWANSKAKGHEAIADNAEANDPASYEVGTFVWGVGDGLKCDHGDLTRCIRYHLEDEAEGKPRKPQLCKIVRIEEVEDIAAVARDYLKEWKSKEDEEGKREGGCMSDDVSDEEMGEWGQNFARLTDEKKRTFYNLCVLVRDKFGRFFLIDPEGYEYSRYVLLPRNWKKVLEPIVTAETERIKMERAEAEAAAAKSKAESKAAYDARCAKWAGIMEPVPEGMEKYRKEYRKIGKRNVAAMAKKAFPWVRFSVSYDGGWGSGYTLKWKNGPTVDEVKKACDFGLFCEGVDTFDGMTGSTDYKAAEFCEFSRKFGGIDNGVELEREECEKDQNGDPNGKPPKAEKPVKGDGGEFVTVTENKEKNGIEIRFPSMPSENIRNYMKAANWRWSKFSKCWYNRATDGNRKMAADIAAMWEKENGKAAA